MASPYKITVAPVANTTYTYTALSDATCSGIGSGSAIVQVAASPTATLAGLQSICLGDSATVSVILTGASPWKLTYTDGTTPISLQRISINPYVFKVAPITSITYTVTAISDMNCAGTASGSFDVNVSQPATATLSGAQTICAGKSTNLGVVFTGVQPYTFTYTDGTTPVTISGIVSNPYALPVAPITTSTYSLTAISDKTCTGTSSGTAKITVTPANDPICTCSTSVDLTGGGSVCTGNGNALNFSFTAASPWDLTYTDGTTPATILGITTSPYSVNVNPASTKTYTVTSVKNATCTGAATGAAVVLVNNVPTATLNGKSQICAGIASSIKVKLTGNQPWTVTYTDGASNTTISGIIVTPYTIAVSPVVTKIYSLVDVTDSQCSGTVSGFDTVMVNPSPTATISGIDTICPGSNSNFTIVLTGKAPWGLTYTDGTTPVAITGIVASPYQVTLTKPAASVTYTLTAVNDGTCTGTVSGSASVFVYAPGTPICNCTAKATLTGGATLCAGGIASLSVDLKGTQPWALTYTDGTMPVLITGIKSSTYSFTVQSLSTKTYKVSGISDVSGCKGLGNGSAVVTVNPFPIASVSGSTSICVGSSATVSVSILGTAPFNLKYTDGTQIVAVSNILASPYKIVTSPASTQVFSVVEFSDAQCTGAAIGAAIITVNQASTATITGGTTICNGVTTNLNVLFTGNKPWAVTYTNGISPVTITNINSNPYSFNVKPSATTTYTLQSSGDSTCAGTASGSTVVSVLSGLDPLCTCVTTAKISGSTAVCAGVGADLKFNFTDVSPWKVVYTDGLKNDTISGIVSNPYTFNVKPAKTTTYTINEISNATCTGNSNGSAAVIINPSPTAQLSDTSAICVLGQATNITVDLTGTSPWKFAYSDGTIVTSLTGITPSSYKVTVNPSINTSYTLQSVSDKFCVGTYSGTALVKVNPLHKLTATGPTNICATGINGNQYIPSGKLAGSNYSWKVTGGQLTSDTSIAHADTARINWDVLENPAKQIVITELTTLGCATDSLKIPIFYDSKGYILEVVSDSLEQNSNIVLKWISQGLTSADIVDVYRRTALPSVGAWTKVASVATKTKDTYTDINVKADQNAYEYILKGNGLNLCGDSMNSNVHRTIQLTTTSNTKTSSTTLNWNTYRGWSEVKEYQVWTKHDAETAYAKESVLSSADSSVVMASKNNELLVCYKILAIEKTAGKIDSSWSNVSCSSFNYQTKATNAFSPNGDGVNDYFFIRDIDKLKSNQVFVFNRWGNVVYNSKNYDNTLVKWDGGDLPEGTYFYIITSEGETIDKGTILLQR